jgi:hypothetical protein
MSAENATHDHTPYIMYIIHTYIHTYIHRITLEYLHNNSDTQKFKKTCTGSMLGPYIHVVNIHTYIYTYIHTYTGGGLTT